MEDLAQINKEIVVKVYEFHDNVVAGRVCVDVLQNHKKPAYLDDCRETLAILLPKSYRVGYLNT